KTCFVCEGEKDADNLAKVGFEKLYPNHSFAYTTSPSGSKGWKSEYAAYFKGKVVIIFPDNDEPGRLYGQQVAHSLKGIASSIRVVELPGLEEKGDVTDYIQREDTRTPVARLADEINKAPGWTEQQSYTWVDADEFLKQNIEARRILLEDSKTN